MKAVQIERLKKWFTDYVGGFYTGGADVFLDKHIRLKEEHTARVCQEMRYVTHGLGLSEDDIHLSQATALLHDIGRFEQMRTYRTYVDPKSVNHGALGVQVLDKEDAVKDLNRDEQAILKAAVKWHGARVLPKGLDERTALFCKLVRDADKLDVLGLLIDNFNRYYNDPEHFDLEVEFQDLPQVSEHVIAALLRRELVDYRQIRTLHDAQLVLLGWVYDINYTAALRRIAEKKYLEQIVAFLPDLPEVQRAATPVLEYVKQRIRTTT